MAKLRTPRLDAALSQGGGISHEDSWVNAFTGFGTTRDRQMSTVYQLDMPLTSAELDALYYGNDVAAKIVELRPKEEFRRGYEVRIDGEGESEVPDELMARARELGLDEKLQEARIWARLYGGCLVILGLNDGGDMEEELNPDAIRSFDYIHIVDKRYALALDYYSDPLHPKFGQPATFSVGDPMFGNWQVVHETRCFKFDGVKVDARRRRANGGWGLSVLQRPYEAMRDFGTAFQSVGFMLSDASQGVLKLHGLVDAIGANRGKAIQNRLAHMDMSRGVNRAIVLDAAKNEEFQKIPTQFSGVSDMLDRYMLRLAAAAEIPVTILMGQSPAGMNATGESDFRHFYSTVESEQVNHLKPVLMRAYDLIARSMGMGEVEGLDFSFNPLWSPTDLEQADLQSKMATADKTYFDIGVLHPSEIALSRFGGGKFSMSTEIDTASRKKELAMDLKEATDPKARAAAQQGDPNAQPPEENNGNQPEDPGEEVPPATDPGEKDGE